jgi:hypothetical protein
MRAMPEIEPRFDQKLKAQGTENKTLFVMSE